MHKIEITLTNEEAEAVALKYRKKGVESTTLAYLQLINALEFDSDCWEGFREEAEELTHRTRNPRHLATLKDSHVASRHTITTLHGRNQCKGHRHQLNDPPKPQLLEMLA